MNDTRRDATDGRQSTDGNATDPDVVASQAPDAQRSPAHAQDAPAHPQIGAAHRRATRLVFLVAGLAMASWAPLVPYAKARLALDEGRLGLLLLALGIGSMVAMPLTGPVAARFGCRLVILIAVGLVCAALPCLAFAGTFATMAAALFLFGAAIGTIDVAINIQAVVVEKASGRALMSGFHGFFSAGGILGATLLSVLLWRNVPPLPASLCMAALLAVLLWRSHGHLLRHGDATQAQAPWLVLPRGVVVAIGLLCFVTFLAEGSMLDWSALFLVSQRGVEASMAGIGYAVFSIAMTIGRLNGDRIVQAFGARRVFVSGALCAAGGFALTALMPWTVASLLGFLLIGLGASNIVPILFTAAGRQQAMPVGLAVSAISTMGYAGILVGPAGIGWIARIGGLPFAFVLVGAALLLVAASVRVLPRA